MLTRKTPKKISPTVRKLQQPSNNTSRQNVQTVTDGISRRVTSNGERIVKIDKYFEKLEAKNTVTPFFGHGVYRPIHVCFARKVDEMLSLQDERNNELATNKLNKQPTSLFTFSDIFYSNDREL